MHATQLGYRRLKYFLHVILSRLPRGGGSRSLYFFLLKVANYKFRGKRFACRGAVRDPARGLHQLSRRFEPWAPAPQKTPSRKHRATTRRRTANAVAHGNADVAEFLRAHGAAEVEGGRLSISPSAAGEVPETFTNPSPRSAGEASAGAASL